MTTESQQSVASSIVMDIDGVKSNVSSNGAYPDLFPLQMWNAPYADSKTGHAGNMVTITPASQEVAQQIAALKTFKSITIKVLSEDLKTPKREVKITNGKIISMSASSDSNTIGGNAGMDMGMGMGAMPMGAPSITLEINTQGTPGTYEETTYTVSAGKQTKQEAGFHSFDYADQSKNIVNGAAAAA